MNEDKIISFIRAYRGAIIGGLIAIVFWFIAVAFSFWSAFFFVLFVSLCAYVGHKIVKHGLSGVIRFLDKLFKNN